MKEKFLRAKKHVDLLLIMVCCFIGVGFISGAEINRFFVQFGRWKIVGIITFFIVSFLLSFKILYSNKKKDFDKNSEEVVLLNKHDKMLKKHKNKCFFTILDKNLVKDFIVFLNVFFISGAMFSGLKNVIQKLFFNNYFLVLILFACALFLITYFGVSFLSIMNVFSILFASIIAGCFIKEDSFSFITSIRLNSSAASGGIYVGFVSIFFAGLYVFMNVLQFEPIAKNSEVVCGRKKSFFYALLFSSILTFFLTIFTSAFNLESMNATEPMPFLTFFLKRGGTMGKIFPIGLLVCLLTTLSICLIGVKLWIGKKVKYAQNEKRNNNFVSTVFSLCLCLAISVVPFNVFVNFVYPLLGALNLLIFVFF